MEYFKIDKLFTNNNNIAIIGKRRSGKTILMEHIVNFTQQSFDEVHVFCYGFLKKHMKAKLKNIKKVKVHKESKVSKYFTAQFNTNKRALFVFDDCLFDGGYRYDKFLNKLFMHSYHINMSTILISQEVSSIPPLIRRQIDLVFVSNEHNQTSISHLNNFCNTNLSSLITQYCNNYTFLVVSRDSSINMYIYNAKVIETILNDCVNKWVKTIQQKKRDKIGRELVEASLMPPGCSLLPVFANGGSLYRETKEAWEISNSQNTR